MADKEQDEDRYVVIIARDRDMGDFRSVGTYTDEASKLLVTELREAFRVSGINLNAYREQF